MRSLLITVHLLSASAAASNDPAGIARSDSGIGGNPSPYCTYNCVNCTGQFYTTDQNGSCVTRSSTQIGVMFGEDCWLMPSGSDIRDAASCNSIIADAHSNFLGNIAFFGSYDVQFSDSTGCYAVARDIKAVGLEKIETRACFGTFSLFWSVIYEAAFLILSVVHGIAIVCLQNPAQVDRDDTFYTFLPGSKLAAKSSLLRRGQGFYVIFYRSLEVIAQIWVPAVSLWVYSKEVVIIVILILYTIPTFLHARWEFLYNYRFMVTPSYCGLLGFHSCNQSRTIMLRLFFICRPFAFWALVTAFTELLIFFAKSQEWSMKYVSMVVLNDMNIYKLAFQNHSGDLLFIAVFWIMVFGTVFYVVLTIKPLLKLMMGWDPENDWIDFDENEEQAAEFEARTVAVCNAACSDMMNDMVDDRHRVESLNVETYTKWRATFAYLLLVKDLIAYVYTVIVLSLDAQYLPAAFLTWMSCVTIFTSWSRGHWKFAIQALHTTIASGVPSRHFLALADCDRRIAIPSLFLSVFGLPLTRPSHPVFAVISFFLLISGTRSVAVWLSDIEDVAIYDVPKSKLIRDSVGAYLCSASEGTSEDEITSEDSETLLG